MAIEKANKAVFLISEDGWMVRVAPGDDLILGRAEDTAHPIPHIAADRRHARVRYAGGRCTIEDLGSTSGTYLNGQLVRKPEAIDEGDVLMIGPFKVSVSYS